EALAAGSLDEAAEVVAEVAELDPHNADALAIQESIELERAARRAAEEEERVRRAVVEAGALFDDGDHEQAFALLDRHAPAHPTVAAARAELQQRALDIEQRRREAEERQRQEEQRRREQEEQRRRQEQQQIAAASERARQAIERAQKHFAAGEHD